MATSTAPLSPRKSLRPKYVFFGFISLLVGYVLVHNESFLFNPQDINWPRYLIIKWWLVPHAMGGACALLLGPLQFSDRLRKRYAKMHRVVGRFYVAGVFIGAPLGFYIQYFEERMGLPRSFTIATAVDAAVWMTTTAIAMAFILNGKVEQHRQWMTRSFAVALVFIEVRVVGGVTGWDQSIRNVETIVWACVAFSVLAGDIALAVQDLLRRRPVPQKAQAAVV